MTRRLALVLATLFVVACGDDDSPPPPMRDAGPRDASFDAPPTPDDATVEDGDMPDVPIFVPPDTGPIDAGPPTDPCADDPMIDRCAEGCAEGTVCVEDLCGGRACVPGRSCASSADCGGRTCNTDVGRCEPSTTGCTSDLECAVGYRCESDACVDRRIPCGIVAPFGCPRGYNCSFAPIMGRLYCVANMQHCASASECSLGETCEDVDGDGMTECLPPGECDVTADCEGDDRCAVDPMAAGAVCEPDGACGSGSCGGGRTCVDPTGSGAPRCYLPGACDQDTDCPAQHVCAAPNIGDTLRCIGLEGDDT